jgi:AcrR family transcriptional regulator
MEVNPSLIIHYFQSKEVLIEALIDYNLERYATIFRFDRTFASATEKLIALIDRLFSRKWNELFDDGVFYSCFAQVFRSRQIREKYKKIHDWLRSELRQMLEQCRSEGLAVDDPAQSSEMIFVLLEGAYYYLSMVGDKAEYEARLSFYKNQALLLLNLQDVPS